MFGASKAPSEIRKILLKDCSLEAVISLPSGVFMPYTGVKTSILVFTKKKFNSTTFHTEKVWFYGIDSDGYSLDANRKLLKEKPLPKVKIAFKKRETSPNDNREQKHFYVPLQDIINNGFQLSFNQYKAFVYELQEYESPKELLKKLTSLETEILKGLKELNGYYEN